MWRAHGPAPCLDDIGGAQVYAVRFMSETTLLTASDDLVHFWDLSTK